MKRWWEGVVDGIKHGEDGAGQIIEMWRCGQEGKGEKRLPSKPI
jgi:hypothetical protein